MWSYIVPGFSRFNKLTQKGPSLWLKLPYSTFLWSRDLALTLFPIPTPETHSICLSTFGASIYTSLHSMRRWMSLSGTAPSSRLMLGGVLRWCRKYECKKGSFGTSHRVRGATYVTRQDTVPGWCAIVKEVFHNFVRMFFWAMTLELFFKTHIMFKASVDS